MTWLLGIVGIAFEITMDGEPALDSLEHEHLADAPVEADALPAKVHQFDEERFLARRQGAYLADSIGNAFFHCHYARRGREAGVRRDCDSRLPDRPRVFLCWSPHYPLTLGRLSSINHA